jgi:uncharacterized RDD family membrane protein YckC
MHPKDYYGGFWLRFCASFIDQCLIILPLTLVLGLIKFELFSLNIYDQKIPINSSLLLSMVFSYSYFVLLQSKYGGTIGKKILGLVVIDEKTGNYMSLSQSFLRSLMMTVSGIIFCLGYVWAGFDSKKKSWHDMAAKTIVIKKKYLADIRSANSKVKIFKKEQLIKSAS